MKKILTLLFTISTLLTSAQSGMLDGSGYAPDIAVTDINGNTHNLYNYLDSGKVVVLELMSVTCGHCQSHAAGTENSYQTNGPSGTNVARFLGLEVNAATDSAAVANFASTYGVTFPIANNISPTAINYQLYYTPGYYVIYPDRSYTTICALYCVTAQNYSTIEGLLNTAIAAWVPPVYGCTDSFAINYNPLANITNDSCDYTSYTITTVGMSFSPDTIVCDVGDTINFILGGYHNAVEVSDSTWLIGGTTSNGGFSFGYGSTGMFIPDDCHTFYYVCQPHASSGMKGVIIAHHPPVFGCTDSLVLNYDSLATVDDGSCTYPTTCANDPISGLGVTGIIHNQATFTFDNMNTYDTAGVQICRVDQLRIQYREVGSSSWSQRNMAVPTGYDPLTGICNSTQNTDKLTLGLTASTTYEWNMKVWYCGSGGTAWQAGPNFTTLGECPNVGNLAVSTPNTTKAQFDWDDSNGAYSFARIKMRVDSISNPTGADWFLVGGFGVSYGTFTKNKNGLVPGETYRGQSRTWCDPAGGAYKAAGFTSLIYWTQPNVVRLEGGSAIANLDVYPNPSRDIFNVSFTSEDVQDLKLRILNVIGEELINENLEQFIGEYTKQIDLSNNAKGIYFLEIQINDGMINKKLILQ
jgi:plastocyanin